MFQALSKIQPYLILEISVRERARCSGQAVALAVDGNLEKITDNRDDRDKKKRGKREEVRCAIVRKSKPQAPSTCLGRSLTTVRAKNI